ncbi:hypothetical protein BDF21DRAFT_400833 [Thamnidium elegans]|nr:hypothetical protein BDF21DRAFT_400833 [Thamnidium elegans]
MFGSGNFKKNGGISKKKPGPKVGSKRDPHTNSPDPKRLHNPNTATNNVDNDDSTELNITEEGTESYDKYIQNFSNVSDITTLNSKYLMKRLAESLLEIVRCQRIVSLFTFT